MENAERSWSLLVDYYLGRVAVAALYDYVERGARVRGCALRRAWLRVCVLRCGSTRSKAV